MFNIAIAKKGNGNHISNSLLQEIVILILKEAAIEDIVLNQRILTCFHIKLQNLLLKGLKAKKSGGRQYRAFLECLNHSEPYRLKIYISETRKLKLAEINKRLLKQNCELQDQLDASASKQQNWKVILEKPDLLQNSGN